MAGMRQDLLSRNHVAVFCQARETGFDLVRSEAMGQAAFFQANLGPAFHVVTFAWEAWSTPIRSRRMEDVRWERLACWSLASTYICSPRSC